MQDFRNPITPIVYLDHRFGGTSGPDMINKIQTFRDGYLGDVRCIVAYGTIYFDFNDVCDISGIRRDRAAQIKEQLNYEYNIINHDREYPEPYYYLYFRIPTQSEKFGERYYDALFISEYAFYSTLVRANSQQAVMFRHWVYTEIAPKLRYMYSDPQNYYETIMNNKINRLERKIDSLNDRTDHIENVVETHMVMNANFIDNYNSVYS